MNGRLLLGVLALGCAAGCGSKASVDPKGSLNVSVTAPSGLAANVTVTGPDGFSKTLTATEKLEDLEPGTYAVSAPKVVVPGAIVSQVFDAAVTASSPAVVASETAESAVVYAERIGTGRIWVSDKTNNTVASYMPDQLATSGTPTPTLALGFPAASQVYSLAFDALGNLWTLLPGGSQQKIVRMAPSLLGASGNPPPTASIADAQVPTRSAFDVQGNLWVANSFNNTIVKYRAEDLTGQGTLDATPVLSFQNATFKYLNGLAFDSSGNLWVEDSNFSPPPGSLYSGVIHRISADQLSQTGIVVATLTATFNHASILAGQGLAFDRNGNLWVTDFGSDGSDPNLIRFDASQLSATGTVGSAPALVVTSANLSSPNSPSFDESGNLWVANYSGRTLVRFSASQLVGTGTTSLTASVVISGPGGMGYSGLAFNPPPAGLPLFR